MDMIPMTRLLRLTLTADAAVSGAAGLLLTLAPDTVGSLTALPATLLLVAGLVFLPYAALCAWLARRDAVSRALLWVLAGGNLLLAVECAALPLLGLVAPSAMGLAFLAIIALTVAVLGQLYLTALRRAASPVAR